ncbi:MAG: peroxiredoxin [Candidatus Marinimicrobia bacterium]|nr:peroxiredoxin [Candidatus Neomarinimicrobiota bacterium]MCF7829034.1 peroxiredoxin [Candidatus Neomarinimicrobiota bacterium]MCF7881829.1 peroxiredoxin [Candidatus Neomarinimicrobiota bacterium]
MLKSGDTAPDFSLPDSQNEMRSLSDFTGTPTVVYFYPKDDTPGCTKEACSFRDNYDAFKDADIDVIGISYDSPESHAEFKEKYNLPFTLLSDSNKEVAKNYGASRGLLDLMGAKRITYLLDEDNTVIKVYPNVTPADHAEEILDYFEKR